VAVAVGAILNPLLLFTALFAATAFEVAGVWEASGYVVVEIGAVGTLVVYLLGLRSRNSSGFWLPVREERLVPAFVLLGLGVATVVLLGYLDAPGELVRLTLGMLATASLVTAMIAWIKASAHAAVACHCAIAGVASLGAPGFIFVVLVPVIMWARIAERAHTPVEVIVGAVTGTVIASAAVLLL
jgi:membrane-associated phospholipid phosphatase